MTSPSAAPSSRCVRPPHFARSLSIHPPIDRQVRTPILTPSTDSELASRHRARDRSIQIIKAIRLPSFKCKRENVTTFHNPAIKFPLPHRVHRPSKKAARVTFSFKRPVTYLH